jgi:proteasome lid subunit RPN8/RPN11
MIRNAQPVANATRRSAILKPRQMSRMRPTPRTPLLRFTPYAWAKLLFLRDLGDTEVGGFGITPPDDPLLVEDVCLVRQQCTPVSVKFEDDSVADFFDQQVDNGRRPEQFGRIWLHTHPGDSAQPSGTDEETFARSFGRTDWAVMFILACGGQTYTRLRFNVGPGGALEIPNEVDFALPFAASRHEAWKDEYLVNVGFAAMPAIGDVWEPWETQEGPPEDVLGAADWAPSPSVEDEMAWHNWVHLMDEPG